MNNSNTCNYYSNSCFVMLIKSTKVIDEYYKSIINNFPNI